MIDTEDLFSIVYNSILPNETTTVGNVGDRTYMYILYVLSGTITIQNEKETFTLDATQALFLCSKRKITIHPVNENKEDPAHIYILRFLPGFVFGDFMDEVSKKYLTPIFTSYECGLILLKGEDTNALRAVTEKIRILIEEQQETYELECKELLCRFYRLLYGYVSKLGLLTPLRQSAKISSYDFQRMKTVDTYLEKHYMEALVLDDIAASIHLSRSECCRCFKRTWGTSPMEYLARYRIMKAHSIMETQTLEELNVSNLAYSVGFNTPSYFNKVFKQFYGYTPTDYMKSRNAHK
jgi:AraC-like DNA-binding protein